MTRRPFDLTSPHAHVLQHTIVEPLELANSIASARFGSDAQRQSGDPQDESPQPLGARTRGGAHTGRDDEIAFKRGSPVEFEGRTPCAKVVISNHGQALHDPIVSTLLAGRGPHGAQHVSRR